MTKILKIPSLLASDTAKARVNIADFTYVLEEVFVSQSELFLRNIVLIFLRHGGKETSM